MRDEHGSASAATKFSDCSIDRYARLISSGSADCLLNYPSPDIIFSLCGNKLVDPAEQCDCGNAEECKADPCCGPECMLKKDAQCGSGICCKDCKLIKKGRPCRIPVSECDLTEYCSGVSGTCPSDFYSLDGTPCNDGQSVCYNKTCYDPNRHCRQLFGKTAKGASPTCFSQGNTIGDRFGNCGYENRKFRKCNER
ncbi:disintegrin and metalloproteinase domain-containing protein 9-like [Microcaecilia unicolor]|uniref:Disintegrin and metalloproteinase domain-containing protein 9-like n=1 Tax=Microcaecilia unicolor TaxID=1415580 RepID=A0A6P7Y5H5_9AMPH|nr:disintegrin and metalloproteinase domain-containing protein 9-like [Microcaecilia unicolor]